MSTTVINLIKNPNLDNIAPHKRPAMLRRDYAFRRLAKSLAKQLLELHNKHFHEIKNPFRKQSKVIKTCPFEFKFSNYRAKTNEEQWEYNIALRDAINAHWMKLEKAGDLKKQAEFAKWFVATWGGVNGNLDETILDYVKRVKYFEIKNKDKMSSFSKILSASNRHKYQIFDMRTAVCLNILQLKFFAGTRYYFQVSPEDKSTQSRKVEAFYERFPRTAFLDVRYKRIYKNYKLTSYQMYLQIVNEIARLAKLDPIEIEMMLFTYVLVLIRDLDTIEKDFEENREWVKERGEYWRARRLRFAKEKYESAAS